MAERISDLITALAAATGPSREMDERIAVEVFGWAVSDRGSFNEEWTPAREFSIPCDDPPAYTSSLDAITGACEQRWPGGNWTAKLVREQPQGLKGYAEVDTSFWSEPGQKVQVCWAMTPALALCLAAARLAAAEAADAPA